MAEKSQPTESDVNIPAGDAAGPEFIGEVESVELAVKSGTGKKGPWELDIVIVGGEKFRTFSRTRAERAQKAKEDRVPVRVVYTEGKYGKEIAEIQRAF